MRIVCCMAACCMLSWMFMVMVSGGMGGRCVPLPELPLPPPPVLRPRALFSDMAAARTRVLPRYDSG